MTREELAEAGYSGARWVGASRVALQLVGFAGSIVLARLIAPAEFGYFAVVATLLMLAGETVGSGITAALVQRPDATAEHLRSASAIAFWSGLLAGLAVLALAPLAGELFGDPIVELVRIAAAYLPLVALAATSAAILQRRLRFALLAAVEAGGVLIGVAASIALAAAGLEGEALVLGAVAGQAAATLALLLAAPPPAPFAAPLAQSRELLRFGLPNAAAAAASVGARNVDYAVLAARAPAASVGFYWRGYQLAVEVPRRFGSGVLGQLALPLYSRASDAEHRLAMRSRIAKLHALIVVPMLLLLVMLAPLLVPGLFGERWEPAVVPTQILAGVGVLGTALAGMGPLISALGRPGALLRWNLVNIAVVGLAVYLAAPHGLTAVCLAVLGVRIARFFAAYAFMLRPHAGVPLEELWLDLGPALLASALMAGAVGLAQQAGLAAAPVAVELACVAVLAPAAYLGALRVLFPGSLGVLGSGLRRLAGGRPKRSGEAAA